MGFFTSGRDWQVFPKSKPTPVRYCTKCNRQIIKGDWLGARNVPAHYGARYTVRQSVCTKCHPEVAEIAARNGDR